MANVFHNIDSRVTEHITDTINRENPKVKNTVLTVL